MGIAARVAPHVQMMSRLIAAPRIDSFLDRYGNAIVIYLSIDIKHSMNIETCSWKNDTRSFFFGHTMIRDDCSGRLSIAVRQSRAVTFAKGIINDNLPTTRDRSTVACCQGLMSAQYVYICLHWHSDIVLPRMLSLPRIQWPDTSRISSRTGSIGCMILCTMCHVWLISSSTRPSWSPQLLKTQFNFLT